MNHLESAARRKLKAPSEWLGFIFECIAEDYIVTGAVPVGFYSRGPRKGKPKWEGPGIKVIVTRAETDAEVKRYEEETGNCAECLGTKEVFASWNIKTGVKMRPCQTCDATGKRRS